MRVLVTGGCGFLGSHIIEHMLKNTDHDVVVLDKMTYASSGFNRLRDVISNLALVSELRDKAKIWSPQVNETGAPRSERVHVLGCDLSQPIPDGVAQEVGAIDYVIHAAAETHVDNSIVDPLPFLQSNVIGTHHLLWWLRKVPSLRRAFLVSTDEVYGPAQFGEDVAGFGEESAFRPANPYAAAKAGGECVAMAYANTYKIPLTIVNTMNLVGERQHAEKFIPLVIRRALSGEKVLIHADPSKTKAGTRFYLHCRTFAHALTYLIDWSEERAAWERKHNAGVTFAEMIAPRIDSLPIKLHVCGEREVSNLDLAQMLAGFVGKPLNYELVDFHSSRPGHDLRYAMDDGAIRRMGWQRPMGLEESLKKTVQWYLNNPKWLELKETT